MVVDDERRLKDLLRLQLDVEGYEVSITDDGASGLIRSRSEPEPDLIILDWNLPDFSDIDICQRMRTGGVHTPILMLTGHDDVHDHVTALDAGIDDYLVRPFSIEELMTRLRATHRRAETFSCKGNTRSQDFRLQVTNLSMDIRTRDVSRAVHSIQLSVNEYELLNFLMRVAGLVLERQEIMRDVWVENFFGDDNLLDIYTRYLRKKIEQPDLPTLIYTVRGVGFILQTTSD